MNTEHAIVALEKTGESYWLGSANYPGYLATVDGRVFSVRRGRFMKPIRLGSYVGLQVVHKDAGLVKRYLHRLMLEFATGIAPADLQGCHNNGDRRDNRLENLRWDTAANNHADKPMHGTDGAGERNPMAKLSAAQVSDIRRLVAAGASQRSLCPVYGVSPMTISRVVRGETWRNT